MFLRRGLAVVAALSCALSGCIGYMPDTPRTISAKAVDRPELHDGMRHAAVAGPLSIDAVIYKPSLPPLSGVMKKVSRGQFKKALEQAHVRYEPSNINDEALKIMAKHGYVPVLVDVLNTGDAPVDLHDLKLGLTDGTATWDPVPTTQLPKRFHGARPQAAVTNIYNSSLVIVGYTTLLVYVVAATLPEYQRARWGTRDAMDGMKPPNVKLSRKDRERIAKASDAYAGIATAGTFYANAKTGSAKTREADRHVQRRPFLDLDRISPPDPDKRQWKFPEYVAGMDMSLDNDAIAGLTYDIPVDYNGLLYRPVTLAPGESYRGLLFFKAEGADRTELRLDGKLAEPVVGAR